MSTQFGRTVHGIALTADGDEVYVGDRDANRFQVFRRDGRFLRERVMGGVWDFSFSAEAQSHLYVVEGCSGIVRILERRTLAELDSFGGKGHEGEAGRFFGCAHSIATSSRGDLFITEIGGGTKPCRVQKFVLKGLVPPSAPASTHHAGRGRLSPAPIAAVLLLLCAVAAYLVRRRRLARRTTTALGEQRPLSQRDVQMQPVGAEKADGAAATRDSCWALNDAALAAAEKSCRY